MQSAFVSDRSCEILFDINFCRNSSFTLHIETFSRFEILHKNNIVEPIANEDWFSTLFNRIIAPLFATLLTGLIRSYAVRIAVIIVVLVGKIAVGKVCHGQ